MSFMVYVTHFTFFITLALEPSDKEKVYVG